MPGLIAAWKDATVGHKIAVITASSLAIGGVAYGIYRLKTQEKKPPPRPSTPVRRVDPFESAPKTPPKTLPKPKLSMPDEKKPEEVMNLSETAHPKTPPSSPVTEDPGPLSASTASFEPISMSQVASMPSNSGDAPVSMPELKLAPQDVQLGSMSSSSPGTADSSMSFVKLSMPGEHEQQRGGAAEDVIKAEDTQQSFAAAPAPNPKPQGSKSLTPSTADSAISFVNYSPEDEKDFILRSQEFQASERERSVEEELEELKLRRARAEDEDEADDGTTMATIGSDTEQTFGGEEEEYEPDFEDEDEDEDEESGDSDIQRLEDDEPAAAAAAAAAAATGRSTQESAASDKLKEKDENDIVVISTDDKE